MKAKYPTSTPVTSTPVPWASNIAWGLLIAHLLASALLFSRSTLDSFEWPKFLWLIFTTLGFLALGANWIVSQRKSIDWRSCIDQLLGQGAVRIISVGVIVFYLSALVSTVSSISTTTSFLGEFKSFQGLLTLSGYVVLYFATRCLIDSPDSTRRLIPILSISALIVAMYGLIQLLGMDPFTWVGIAKYKHEFRPFSTLGHPNHYGTWLVMALPMVIYCAYHHFQHKQLRWLWIAVALAMLIGILGSLSRGAWLSLTMVLLFAGFWLYRTQRQHLPKLQLLATIFIIIVGGAIWLKPDLPKRFFHRLTNLTDDSSRGHVWQASWKIFQDYPMTGSGVDTFAYAFARHRPAAYAMEEWKHIPNRAHNEIFHLLATQGALGVLAISIFGVGIILCAIRSLRSAQGETQLLTLALCTSLLGFAISSMFSFSVISTGSLFLISVAMLTGVHSPQPVPESATARQARPSLAALPLQCVIMTVFVWSVLSLVMWPAQAMRLAFQGDALRTQGNHEQAIVLYQDAIALSPSQEALYSKLSMAQQHLALQKTQDAAWQTKYLQQAAQTLKRVIDLIPANPEHYANLARVQGQLCQWKQLTPNVVFATWSKALQRDPNNPQSLIDASMFAIRHGKVQQATRYAQRASQLFPDLAHPFHLLSLLAYAQRDYSEAWKWTKQAEGKEWFNDPAAQWNHRVLQAQLYLQQGHLAEAYRIAKKASQDNTQAIGPFIVMAKVSEALGDTDDALKHYQWILTLAPKNRTAQEGVYRLSQRD